MKENITRCRFDILLHTHDGYPCIAACAQAGTHASRERESIKWVRAGEPAHGLHDVAPGTFEYEPGAHAVHPVAALVDDTIPGGHVAHVYATHTHTHL